MKILKRSKKKTNWKYILIGIGVFIICFVLIYDLGSSSLPKTSNQLFVEKYNWSFPPVGGDNVRIQDDLIFFWPLVFTRDYHEDGNYYWAPIDFRPTEHPFVLLYWALVSVIISLIVVLVVRIFLKGKK